MRAKPFLSMVGASGNTPPSPPEQIFRDYVNGSISKESYETLTVLWVSDNANLYRPPVLPEPDQVSRQYVMDRLDRRTAYNYDSAKLLGEWFAMLQQFLDARASDMELLIWSYEKCSNLTDVGSCEKISRVLKLYDRDQIDSQFIEQTLQVKKLDAYERERAKR